MADDDTTPTARDLSAVPRPSAVQVNLPVDWLELPLDLIGDLSVETISDQLELTPEQRPAVQTFLLEAQQIYLDSPAVFAAMYALFGEDDQVVLMISMAILMDVFPSDDTPALDLVDAIQEGSEDLRDAELIETPIGSAVRAHLITEPDPESAALVAGTDFEPFAGTGSFSTQYFIPILGREHMAVVAFTSPNVEVREALTPLFDDIVETIRFRWPAPPRVAASAG